MGRAKAWTELKAVDVMKSPVSTVSMEMSLREAAGSLSDNHISGAPVVDLQGKPVGVISLFDIATCLAGLERPENAPGGFYAHHYPSFDEEEEILRTDSGEKSPLDATTVGQVMTPEIFSVPPETPLPDLVRKMWKDHIHRVFVSRDDTLLGVISTMDVLREISRGGKKGAGARKK